MSSRMGLEYTKPRLARASLRAVDEYDRQTYPYCRRSLSHVTLGLVAHCVAHAIDLVVLPAHPSHVTQPLDVSVFGPLKTALAKEMVRDEERLQKADWTHVLVQASRFINDGDQYRERLEIERPLSL